MWPSSIPQVSLGHFKPFIERRYAHMRVLSGRGRQPDGTRPGFLGEKVGIRSHHDARIDQAAAT
jgi:hypothetical protein